MKKQIKYIPQYVGTFDISLRDKVKDILQPILEHYKVTIRCRGRGPRSSKIRGRDWFGRLPYHQSLPLEVSERFAVYITVKPTNKFVEKYKKLGGFVANTSHFRKGTVWETVSRFEEILLPIVQDELVENLKKHNIVSV